MGATKLKNTKSIVFTTTFVLSIITASAYASSSQNEQTLSPFDGTHFAGGAIFNTGNVHSRDFDLISHIVYSKDKWVHTFDTNYQYAHSKQEGTSANQFYTKEKSDFYFNSANYAYGSMDYENNRFDGYDYIVNVNTGYGRHFQMPQNMSFDIFFGPGVRLDKQQLNDKSRTIATAQIGSDYSWNINDITILSENVVSNYSKETIDTRSVTAITNQLNDHLKYSINFELDHSSKPIDNTKSLNTATSLNLIYAI